MKPHPKKKEKKLSQLIKELDAVFSKFIRKRDSDENGTLKCVSCKEPVFWKDAHCCHYMDRQYKATRWDESNCAGGCAGCNQFRKGFHIHHFGIYLNNKYGQGHTEYLELKAKQPAPDRLWVQEKISYYSGLL